MNEIPRDPGQPVEPDFDAVAELFVAELRAGKHPSIADYREKYPQMVEEIDDLFPMLFELETHEESSPSGEKLEIDSVPERLGEYEIIREVGRGGMGVVYEALHSTMERRVALKVLPRTFGEKKQYLDRFMLEARSAGRLHHTNIVPVFEIGNEDGVYFYAMQYIHGQNLDVVIDELQRFAQEAKSNSSSSPRSGNASVAMTIWKGQTTAADESVTLEAQPAASVNNDSGGTSEWARIGDENDDYFRRVARVGIQIAEALEFAHEHGLLHRDIKPSNLILDTNGVVWITDFGLAKLDGDNLTHTGDIVGTIRYMAPERFQGKADRRSDLYSLGLTLYELCTLEYAFDATDRAALINQVMNDSPASLRKIRRDVPADLETVIVKAMARDPESRYSQARNLAADLRRFVAGRPVHARRVSMVERMWRWSKRHPSRAALALSLLLLGTTIVCGSLYFGYKERMHSGQLAIENQRARDAEQEALAAEKEARELAEKAQRATRASDGHRFWSHYNAGKALRDTGTPGQRNLALNELVAAYQTLATLDLSESALRRRQLAVRCQAIASLGAWEMSEEKLWPSVAGWTEYFDIDFRNDRYARADQAGEIEIRELKNDKPLKRLSGVDIPCWALLFSPDGKYLATMHHPQNNYNHRTLVVWDVEEGSPLIELEPGISYRDFRFSSDSQRIGVTTKTGVQVHKTSDGSLDAELDLQCRISSLRFAYDNQQLILVGDPANVIQFWSLQTRELVKEIELENDVFSLDWNERTRQLAAGGDRTITIWPLGQLDAEPIELIAHSSRVTDVAFESSGKMIASSGWDHVTRVFELTHYQQIIQTNAKPITSAGFSPDGSRLLFTTRDRQSGLWKFDDFRARTSLPVPTAEKPQKIRFHPGDSEIIGLMSRTGVTFHNHITKRQIGTIEFEDVFDYHFTADGKHLFTSGLQGVQKWPVTLNEGQLSFGDPDVITHEKCKFMDLNETVDKIIIRPDSPYVQIIPLDGSETVRIGPHARVNHAWFDPSGTKVVTCTWQGKGVKVWDAKTGELLKDLVTDEGTSFIGFSPDGKSLATSTEDQQTIWELESLEKKLSIDSEVPDGTTGKVIWSNDNRFLVCNYTAYQPQLVDPASGETLAVLEAGDQLRTGEMRFSHNDRYLAVIKNDQLHIWDIQQTREQLKDLGMNW